MSDLSAQMRKLLGLMEPGKLYNEWTIQEEFYGVRRGSYGYVSVGRGRGTGSLVSTFKALEKRGLADRTTRLGHRGWVLTDEGAQTKGES